MKSSSISKSYRLAFINLALFIIAFASIIVFKDRSDLNAILFGLPLFTAGIFAIIGTTYLVKGRKEKKGFKFIFALIINLGIAILFTSLIIANLKDFMSIL